MDRKPVAGSYRALAWVAAWLIVEALLAFLILMYGARLLGWEG